MTGIPLSSIRLSGLAVGLALAVAPAARAETRVYLVDPQQSRVAIEVGRAGLLKFAGHEHEVVGPVARGEVMADEADPARSSVWLSFDAAALKVTGRGEPAKDVPKVQEKMQGPEVLDVARHPTVDFRSTGVSAAPAGGGRWNVQVSGDLTLRGVTRRVSVPLQVTVAGGVLSATGRTVIRHSDFGLKPVSVAGVVKVKNELTLAFTIAARARP